MSQTTNPSVSSRLQEIRERVEKARGGPWIADPIWQEKKFEGNKVVCEVMRTWLVLSESLCIQVGYDAEFIAHARSDVPFLLGLIEEMRKGLTP